MDESLTAGMAMEQLLRRRRMWALAPAERLRLALELTRNSMQLLERNPEAHRAFLARQHQLRRESSARQLELICGGSTDRELKAGAMDRCAGDKH